MAAVKNDQPPQDEEGGSLDAESAPAMARAGEKEIPADEGGVRGGGGGGGEEEPVFRASSGEDKERGEALPGFEKTCSVPIIPAIDVDPSLPTDNFTRISRSIVVGDLKESGMWIEVSSDDAARRTRIQAIQLRNWQISVSIRCDNACASCLMVVAVLM